MPTNEETQIIDEEEEDDGPHKAGSKKLKEAEHQEEWISDEKSMYSSSFNPLYYYNLEIYEVIIYLYYLIY